MGRAPCCDKVGLKRGRWTAEEDEILTKYILENGEGSWRSLPKNAGLLRCGKSCRLRWINYLRADLKRGNISSSEEDVIINLHASVGNKWSLIANQLPGRTDNEIKNYWNSHLSRRFDTFRRSNKDALPLIINLKQKGKDMETKRKGGRTSRAAMKKNKAPYTNKDNINSNNKVNSFPQQGQEIKMTSSSTVSWNEEELESLVLDSWVVNSPCLEDNIEKSYSAMAGSEVERGCMVYNNLNEDVIICSKNSHPLGPGAAEDQANSSRQEISGPQAEEEKKHMQGSYGVLSSDGVVGTIYIQTQSPSGVWPCNINEESESGATTSFTRAGTTNEDPETGSSSNCGGAVSSENWHNTNSSTTSYFDEEILEWGWQNVIHGFQELQQNQDQEEMISSLWGNDDYDHDLGLVDHPPQNFDALGGEIMDMEKQKTAVVAWLFS